MENEKKDVKVAVISIILAIICLIILGYIIYIRVNSDSKKKIEDKPQEPIIEDKDPVSEEPKKPQITEDEVATLYDIIKDFPEFRSYTTVTYVTLNEELKDRIILNKLRPDFVCTDEILFVKELFLTTYKDIFNNEKASDEGICKLDQTNYECYVECNEEVERNINKYLRYEIEENNIVIYEKYGYLDYLEDGVIYLKPSIDDLETIESYNDIKDIIIENIEDKIPTYKHTFKFENDNYYWVSSEIVKQ